jgi:hypothetical protein
MPKQPKPQPVVCKQCGQRGDQPPGLKLREPRATATFVGDELVPTPQILECRACGWETMVPRNSIEVVKRA